MNGLALCAGVGGLELGLHLALGDDYRTVCFVEREAHAAACLVARMGEGIMAPAPVWDDLATFDGRRWRGCVDIISAGYPCQPFSAAARGRHSAIDLQGEVLRVVREAEPSWVFLENVYGAGSSLAAARCELERAGLRVAGPLLALASDVGAPHERGRLFVLGYSDRHGEPRLRFDDETSGDEGTRGAAWEAVPERLGVADGVASRVDRLRACGNGVVPLVAAHAFRTLAAELLMEES